MGSSSVQHRVARVEVHADVVGASGLDEPRKLGRMHVACVVFDGDPDVRVDSQRLRAAADRDEILHVPLDAAVGEAVLPRAEDDTDDGGPERLR